jgi:hypothetical protein
VCNVFDVYQSAVLVNIVLHGEASHVDLSSMSYVYYLNNRNYIQLNACVF